MSEDQSTSVRWGEYISVGILDAEKKRDGHQIEAAFYQQVGELLVRNAHKRPEIRFVEVSESPFVVTIPPFLPNHFDGNGVLAPFGDTYWPTWDAAKEFYDNVIRDVELGKYNPEWKG